MKSKYRCVARDFCRYKSPTEENFTRFCLADNNGNCDCAVLNPTPKDLLTVGRVVELRNGTMGFVLPDRFIAKDGWININNYGDSCDDCSNSEYDIVKIYNAPIIHGSSWSLKSRDYSHLDLVWQRESKSSQQIEKESIQIEMEKLAKRLKELEVK